MCAVRFSEDLSSKSSFWAFHLESNNTSLPRFFFFRKTDLVRMLHICSNIKLMHSDPLRPSKPNFGKVKGLCVPGGASPQCSTHLESSLLCSFWTTNTRLLCSCSNHIFSPAILSAGGRWRSWGLPAEQLRHPRWSPTYQTTYQDWQKQWTQASIELLNTNTTTQAQRLDKKKKDKHELNQTTCHDWQKQ